MPPMETSDKDKKKTAVAAPAEGAGTKKMHAFLDKLDKLFNPTPRPRPVSPIKTAPIIRFNQTYLVFRTVLSNSDTLLAIVVLVFQTLLLFIAPGDAKLEELFLIAMTDMGSRAARVSSLSFPRMLSADLVLIILGAMAVNGLALAIIRVVEREHRKNIETKQLEELNEVYDIDPEKSAAYEAKLDKAREERKARRDALVKENEQRKARGQPPKRDIATITGIVEVDAVTDAIVPIVIFWPIILGTVVVLQHANAVRGACAAVQMLHMCLVAMMPKMTGSIPKTRAVLNVAQSVCVLLILAMITMQCYFEA